MFPAMLLAKLYVKGSLRNNDAGFEFALKNMIDSAVLIGVGPVTVGETAYEGAAVSVAIADKTYNGADLSRHNPLSVRMGTTLRVLVQGARLNPGSQKITVAATSGEIGKVKLDFSDTVA